MQAELFELLKTVLKARRMTYADLAELLGLSEPTIKRIFAERDCKLSRMNEICAALGLTLDDLVAEANRVEVQPIRLTDRQEARLADDRPAFNLFLLLLDGMTIEAIQEQYRLEKQRVFKLGIKLEKIGLAEVMPGNRIRLTVQSPVEFRRDGPLHQALVKLNMAFLRSTYLARDTEHSAYLTQTRRMTQKTAKHILARLRDVQVELSNLARRDQLTQPENALQSFKIGIALSPIVFSELLLLAEEGS
ncbi:helix-turn-helix transcriptional regulator [Puniceibacterium sp. IMCC21224]|uniref:helix-turn-helix domain-containing protein n=1 Tax=Puniceibacterium sp. IMCC21224 TaxID=1618204 RepID=UPI00065D7FE0|nr:helix-turn-helix transcriptional regulator [Puniceibacterium sp. IMCC21224]KMK64686.1 Cro/C1-type HTH DNA-binding domain [Puniceibacterium sp. IMCC21224]